MDCPCIKSAYCAGLRGYAVIFGHSAYYDGDDGAEGGVREEMRNWRFICTVRV